MKKIFVQIDYYPIRLGQFLKYANLVSDGVEAREIITQGLVRVNDEVERRRGRQLKEGDRILYEEMEFVCASS